MNITNRQKLNLETAQIKWSELQTYFAGGKVVQVKSGINLLDAAEAMAEDNKEKFKLWMSEGKIEMTSDEQAKIWFEEDATVWAVVVRPFVLVQDS